MAALAPYLDDESLRPRLRPRSVHRSVVARRCPMIDWSEVVDLLCEDEELAKLLRQSAARRRQRELAAGLVIVRIRLEYKRR